MYAPTSSPNFSVLFGLVCRNYMTLFFVVEINRKSNNCISNSFMSSMDSIKFYISDTGQAKTKMKTTFYLFNFTSTIRIASSIQALLVLYPPTRCTTYYFASPFLPSQKNLNKSCRIITPKFQAKKTTAAGHFSFTTETG